MTYRMTRARHLAQSAASFQEVPVGAVLFHTATGRILAEGHNLVVAQGDPTAHAEMVVIREGCRRLAALKKTGVEKPIMDQSPPDQDVTMIPHATYVSLEAYTLTVTLEPCAMCAQAMAWARLGRLVFGAYDPKSGGVDHGARVFDHPTCHHKPLVVGGVQATACGVMLQGFFQSLRQKG